LCTGLPPAALLLALSLHDALPISASAFRSCAYGLRHIQKSLVTVCPLRHGFPVARYSQQLPKGSMVPVTGAQDNRDDRGSPGFRSEEHTSELQSRENPVWRLLLGK